MFYTENLEKEIKKREQETKNEQKRYEKEIWEKIQCRDDLDILEKELLMVLMTEDFIKTTSLKYKFKEQYQSLIEKGYCHILDASHTWYNEEPISREVAEKLAIENGWKKKNA